MLREPACEVHQRDGLERLFRYIHDDPRWLPFLESIGKSPKELATIEYNVTLSE